MSLVNLLCHKFVLRKFIFKFGYEDKFVHMTKVTYTSILSEIKINGLLIFLPLYKRFGRVSTLILLYITVVVLLAVFIKFGRVSTLILLYITVVVLLAVFINADRRIKGVQIGDHESKLEILLMIPPIFLRELPALLECK